MCVNTVRCQPASAMVANTASGADGQADDAAARPSAVARSAVSEPEVEAGAEDVLETALHQLGPFGLYHFRVLLLLCIANLFSAMYTVNYVFVADHVPFRCVVPECEGDSPQFLNATVVTLLPNDDACQRYEPLLPLPTQYSCTQEQYHPTDMIACEQFVYLNIDTIFAEFGLACREWLRTLVGSVRNIAMAVALVLTGYVTDLWGRRTAFCLFSAFAGVMGIVKATSVNYNMYLAMESLEAALGYGFEMAAFIWMVELARPSLRAAFTCAIGAANGLGGMLFALIAWRVPYWRHLLFTIHAPALLLPFCWLLLDESPRWLHARGRALEAANVIRKAARTNKVILDSEVMTALEKDKPEESVVTGKNPWLSVVSSRKLLVRFVVCSWCTMASTFVYYGLTINSVALAGDKYLNFALNMAMEVVASLVMLLTLDRFGRKWSLLLAFLVAGVACVTPLFATGTGTRLGMYLLGKLAITFAFNSMNVITAELFPTHARSSALAAISLVGGAGAVIAPQTPLWSTSVQAFLFAGCSLTAALAVLAMPETRRAALPSSVRAAETLRPPAYPQGKDTSTSRPMDFSTDM